MLCDIGDKTGLLFVFCTTDCADTDSYCGCQTTLRDILDTTS